MGLQCSQAIYISVVHAERCRNENGVMDFEIGCSLGTSGLNES